MSGRKILPRIRSDKEHRAIEILLAISQKPGPMPLIASTDNKIKVLIADSANMSCHFLADALGRDPRYQATAVVARQELVTILATQQFHVLLISGFFCEDSLLPFPLLREIRSICPELGVVLLLDSLDRNVVVEAFRSGANGVFWRTDSFENLCKCIACVHAGQTWADSEQMLYLIDALAERGPMQDYNVTGARSLSRREEEIARLAAKGLSNRQISEQLDLSEHTVKNYLFRVFEKLGVSTRVELTLHALHLRPQKRQKVELTLPPLKEKWYGTG